MRKTRLALLQSVLALLLCCAMLIGTTFAWFTDSVTSGVNRISAGELDVELEYLDKNGNWKDVTETTNVFAEDTLWEPGHTEVVYLRISNQGSLALKYQLGINIVSETPSINVDGQPLILSEHIRFGVENNRDGKTAPWANRDAAIAAVSASAKALSTGHFEGGKLYPADNCPADGKTEQYIAMAVYMPGSVGNEANYMTGENAPEIMLGIKLVATQQTSELDSFDSSYDAQTTFPPIQSGSISELFNVVNGLTAESRTMLGNGFAAEVPVGVKVTKELLTLSISEMADTNANIATASNELLRSLDVHMDGVAPDNTVPMKIMVENAMMVGLNSGNFTLYHVENNVPVAMTAVNDIADLDVHNEFYYDPATGDVTLCMATFSEVALVADIENKWNGDIADDFAGGDGTAVAPYLIANADQLAMFSAMVGGMTDRYEKNDFEGKFVKLLVNINLGGEENTNAGKIFYPIGYYNSTDSYTKTADISVSSSVSSFEGTFDGDGHKISNLYQNTWEMFGDYNSGYSGTPNHYKDGMGLFGYVLNGTVKNLTVDSFSSDGEFTPTGVIAAYASNSTFTNIAITNCNPRVYNTGNGGIVGIGGNDDDPESYKLTFSNITIDNTNKITALWGSWDVACGGLIGMFRGAGHVYMTNCHVGAQIDVYNDVCGNYQYYWYRYAGILIGTNKNMETVDGRVKPVTENFHAENCTVHFGDWNNYYYCELVANSLASYTHDHQFSRLTEIQNVSEIQDESGNWNQTGNFIVMNGKIPTDTCYHIMKDSNGNLYEHKHDEADATNPEINEFVNGATVLKENNQRIHLPFNQLFTGYGWGVEHVPIYGDTELNPFKGVTILDRANANSVDKFYGNGITELAENSAIKIGAIFSALENSGVAIIPGALNISVTNKDMSHPVYAVFTRDVENWEDGTITFYGTGRVQVTIQDYYFCKPTTIELDIVKNLVLNGNFEISDTELTGWTAHTNSVRKLSIVSDVSGNTTNVLKAEQAANDGNMVLISDTFAVEDSKRYDISFDLRYDTTVNTAKAFSTFVYWYAEDAVVTIKNYNEVHLDYTKVELPAASSDWKEIRQEIEAPEGAAQALILLTISSKNAQCVYVDDVKVDVAPPTNYVPNGNFELLDSDGTLKNWTVNPKPGATVTVVTEGAYSGNSVLCAANHTETESAAIMITSSNIQLGDIETVKLSVLSRRQSGDGTAAYIGLWFKDSNSDDISNVMIDIADTADWTEYTLIQAVPEGATKVQVKFGNHTNRTVSYMVDNIRLEEYIEPSEPAGPANKVVNGNFEASATELTGWTPANNSKNKLSIVSGVSGNTTNVLKAEQDDASGSMQVISDVFAVEGGKTYDVSLSLLYDTTVNPSRALAAHVFWYAEDAEVTLSNHDTAEVYLDLKKVELPVASSNWTEWRQEITAPEGAAKALIRFYISNKSAQRVYIDDIVIADAN